MMRFMMIVKATKDSEAGVMPEHIQDPEALAKENEMRERVMRKPRS